MFAVNAHSIRHASEADRPALDALAILSGTPAIHLPALVGEVDGRPVAAVSLIDCRVVADPRNADSRLTPMLLLRARVIQALHAMPSLRARVAAGIRA